MASADFCSLTPQIAPRRAVRAGLLATAFARRRPVARRDARALVNQWGPAGDWQSRIAPPRKQISPNKNMSFQCTTAAFTLLRDISGFVILC